MHHGAVRSESKIAVFSCIVAHLKGVIGGLVRSQTADKTDSKSKCQPAPWSILSLWQDFLNIDFDTVQQ